MIDPTPMPHDLCVVCLDVMVQREGESTNNFMKRLCCGKWCESIRRSQMASARAVREAAEAAAEWPDLDHQSGLVGKCFAPHELRFKRR